MLDYLVLPFCYSYFTTYLRSMLRSVEISRTMADGWSDIVSWLGSHVRCDASIGVTKNENDPEGLDV